MADAEAEARWNALALDAVLAVLQRHPEGMLWRDLLTQAATESSISRSRLNLVARDHLQPSPGGGSCCVSLAEFVPSPSVGQTIH